MATATPYISNPLEMIKPSARAFRTNIGTLFGLLAVLIGLWLVAGSLSTAWFIGQFANGFANPFNFMLMLALVAAAAALLAGLWLYPASNLVLLASARNQKITLSDALKNAKPFIWRTLVASILTVLAVIGGLILFIIPGLIFLGWFALSSYAVVSEDLGAVDSMKRSKALVKGRVWELYGLMMLPSATAIVPFIGPIISFVVSILMIPASAIRFVQLVETKPEDRPKVHWINYASIVLAIIGSSMNSSTSTMNQTDYNSII